MSKDQDESSDEIDAKVAALLRMLTAVAEPEETPAEAKPATREQPTPSDPLAVEKLMAALGVPDLSGVRMRRTYFSDENQEPAKVAPPAAPVTEPAPPSFAPVAVVPPNPTPQILIDPDPIGRELRRQTRRILEAHGLDPTIVVEPEPPSRAIWTAPAIIAPTVELPAGPAAPEPAPPPETASVAVETVAPAAPSPATEPPAAPSPEPPPPPKWVVPAAVPAPEPFSQDVWRASAVPAAPKPSPAPETARTPRAQPADVPEALKPTTPPKPAPAYVKDLYTHFFVDDAEAAPAQASQAAEKGGRNPTMYLGTIVATDSVLDELVQKRREHVADAVSKRGFYLADYDLMPLEEYIETVKKFDRLLKAYDDPHTVAPMTYAQKAFLRTGYIPKGFSPDAVGWRRYLESRQPAWTDKAIKDSIRPSEFPESGRWWHTLVLGASGWGKSELLKAIMYHYVQDGSAGCVVLDPLGDLAKQVMRWPELVRQDRVRIVQPGLLDGLAVGINPFDGTGLDDEGCKLVAGDWAVILSELTDELTTGMELLVIFCLRVLLTFPGGCNLDDLHKLLLPRPKGPRGSKTKLPPPHPRAAELLNFACNRHPDERVRTFFQTEFEEETFTTTRSALRKRINYLFNIPYAEGMLRGDRTLNLEAEIEARRFVVVDLSRFGKHGRAPMGKLFVGLLAAIGRRREREAREDRVPVHLIIDEASTMVSPEMIGVLRELRKFKMFLTLAQQRGGDKMGSEETNALKINTGCKLVAPASEVERFIDLPDGYVVPKLEPGEFVVKWATNRGDPPIPLQVLRVHSDLADTSHQVSDREWRALLDRLPVERGGYYRSAVIPSSLKAADPDDEPDDNVSPELAGRLRQPAEPDEFA